METLIIKIIPIVVCLALGVLFRKRQLLSGRTIDDLKFIVINVALPPVLFRAFSRAGLSLSLLFVPVAVFLLCFLLFVTGIFIRKYVLRDMHYTPFFMTGFEFGMIGSALFISLYGISAIEHLSLVIIGHELFIWFVYFPFIGSGKRPFRDIVSSSVRSPILIAIVVALIINVSGLGTYVLKGFPGSVIEAISRTLASLIAPLILFIVGYNLTVSLQTLKKVVPYILTRLLMVAGGGAVFILLLYLVYPVYIKELYVYILIFLFLPPPYILPLFIDKEDREEIEFFSGTNVYYTIISFILIFAVLMLVQLKAFAF